MTDDQQPGRPSGARQSHKTPDIPTGRPNIPALVVLAGVIAGVVFVFHGIIAD